MLTERGFVKVVGNKQHTYERGFTLVELMATLVILSMITVIAIPSIGRYVFYGNNFTSVTLPDTVSLIGTWAFSNNPGLTIYGTAGSAASEYFLDPHAGQSFVVSANIIAYGKKCFFVV